MGSRESWSQGFSNGGREMDFVTVNRMGRRVRTGVPGIDILLHDGASRLLGVNVTGSPRT
jgi:hypothetical protein